MSRYLAVAKTAANIPSQ